MHLEVVLPPSHQGELQSLLHELYDSSSRQFHKWLKRGRFARRFAPLSATVSSVISWLHGKGLESTSVSGFAVRVTARSNRVEEAFGTSFERYRGPGGNVGFIARETPLVPASLGGKISAILGLNTVVEPVNEGSQRELATRDEGSDSPAPRADGLTSCSAAEAEAAPGYYTLDQLGSEYGIGSLLADGQNGSGETIGLYELGSHSASDVSQYQACFGLDNLIYTVPVDGGGGSVGGAGTDEADADIEQAITQAPDSSVISYEGPATGTGPYDTWDAIVAADAAQVISSSIGICEPYAVAGELGWLPAFSPLFEQAALQGQTVLVAAGDSGSEGCFVVDGTTGAQVDYPASDPNVTAVGGTELFGPGSEVAWNYCQSDESITCAESEGGRAAGGGGMSRYEPISAYQPSILYWDPDETCGEFCREVPDISSNAGIGMVVYEDGAWGAVGGTSLAAPLMAGLVADRNDACSTSTGLWTPALYGLYEEGAYGTAFNDITSGDNDMTGSLGGAYPATPGYDAATGIGSPIAGGLSCPEVTSVEPAAAYPGSEVTVSGLGLEHAYISFGAAIAQVVSSSATSAIVVVPSGSGTVTVDASGDQIAGTQSSSFTYSSPPPATSPSPPSPPGYREVASDGGIFAFHAPFYGSEGGKPLNKPIVGIADDPATGGYWEVASDGGIFAFHAPFYGSEGGKALNAPIVGMSASATTGGYWFVAADGGIFSFHAPFYGSEGGQPLNKAIVGMAGGP